MHKFFVEEDQIENDYIDIKGEDVNHIKRSLRLDVDDQIIIACKGINYLGEIEDISNNNVKVKILSKEEGKNESKLDIRLFQGFARGERMDFVFQKATEIGIKEFYIVEMDRSVVRSKGGKWEKNRLKRYNKITEEAAKQCKRDMIPEVKDIIKFKEMLNLLKDKDNILVPYELEEGNEIGNILKEVEGNEINLIIGPEGGFSEEEIRYLKEIGGKTISLGPRILRTETAGIVASTIILYELGNIGVI